MPIAPAVLKGISRPEIKQVLQAATGVWEFGFARSLGCYDHMTVSGFSDHSNQHMEGLYTIPGYMCTQSAIDKSVPPWLPCGATLALFDEFSSVSMMMTDRTHRPGVSITLSCEMFRRVGPGETVKFVSHTTKIGSMLGFATFNMLNQQGELAARGRHVKYLPMGRVWDLAMQPVLRPLFMRMHQRDVESRRRDPQMVQGVPEGSSLLDSFPLVDVQEGTVQVFAVWF